MIRNPVQWMLGLTAALFVLGAVLMWGGSRNVPVSVRRQRWLKFGTYVAIIWSFLGLSALEVRWPLLTLTAVLVLQGARELVTALSRARRWDLWPCVPVYLMAASALVRVAVGWSPGPHVDFMWVLILTAVFDAFSQLFGQWWGRTLLLPSVSPAKTVFGVVGGVVMAMLVESFLTISSPTPHDRSGGGIRWVDAIAVFSGSWTFILPLCLAALSGDLSASWVKRRCGIKDYGTLLSGHGGVLDRFDSLLGTATFFAIWTTIRLGR